MRTGTDDAAETQVQVCVRARPLLPNEASHYERQCIRVADGNSIVVGNDRAFGFDRVFAADVGGEAIFSAVGHPTIEAFLDGFNATILAYGQTGAGKTFTMNDLMKRCVHHLHKVLSHDCKMTLSVLEVYNEQVIDLLDPSRPRLQVREGNDGDVFAAGQMVAEVTAAADLLSYIEAATSSRSTASTNTNATSSRSHCIATVMLTTKSDTGRVTSRLNFVDLAGSERIKKAHTTANTGGTERVREGIHINGGLLALGNVIHALCDGKSHVPFRSSKLTRMLQSSLAGNSRTVMIACVSSSDQSMDETLNTLKYADRARRIRLKVSRNAHVLDEGDQTKIIMMLRNEVKNLQATLLEHHIPVPQDGSGDDDRTLYDPDSTRDFQKRVITLEEELAREKRFSRTLEEDLYRAEFCAMRELETVKELQRKIQILERANRDSAAANVEQPDVKPLEEDENDAAHQQPSGAEVEQHLEERFAQIKQLEDGQMAYQRTVDDYQRRLKTVLQDKVRLQRELETAEQRLEETQMEAQKKEQHRASLKASFDARLRAAEVAAAEYRRRVKDAEAVMKSRSADEEQLAKLRREAAALTEQLQRQRNQSRHEHIKLGKLVVNQRTELNSLSRKLRELETQKTTQPTPRRNIAAKVTPTASIPRSRHEDPRTSTPPPAAQDSTERGLEAAIASLMSLDQDIADAERERESIRNALEVAQASSETARWRRALKGFQLRLDQVEEEMRQYDGNTTSNDETTYRRHHLLKEERRSIQKKMTQLDDLRPACDDAMDQLREVEERIDSLRAARTYRMKVVRSMQQSSSEEPHRQPSPPRQNDQHGLRDTVRAQQMLIEELNQRITDQALLLQQLLPLSKEANRTMLLRGGD